MPLQFELLTFTPPEFCASNSLSHPMQTCLDVYSVAIFYLRCPIAKRSPLFLKAFENYVNMNLLFQLVAFFFCSDCTHKLLHISCIWKIEPIKCLCTWNKASLKFTPGTLKMKLEIYRRSSSEKTKKRHTKHSTPWAWRAGTFCREQKMKWPS